MDIDAVLANLHAEVARLRLIKADSHEVFGFIEWSGRSQSADGAGIECCPFCSSPKYFGEHTDDCRLFLAKERTK